MGDRFHTEIEIGGPITREQLKEIAGHAAACGLSVDWEQVYEEGWILDRLEQQIKQGSPCLSLSDPEVSHEFESTLTEYLLLEGIPWNKKVDPKYEYDGEITWWRKGMKAHKTWMTNTDAIAVVTAETLRTWLAKRKTLKWVVEHLSKIPPPLPRIVLKDTPSPGGQKGS